MLEHPDTACSKQLLYKLKNGANEVAQQVKALASRSNDLSSSPRTHLMEGENQIPQVSERERVRDRQRHRETQTNTEIETDRQRQRDRKKENEKERERAEYK
jgi:X-X-X-Leu-X-X-Gly heptad repeat protein